MISRHKFSIIFLMWLLGCKEINKDKPVPVPSGNPIDKVRLTDLENKPVDLKEYHGKTIFVNFWATWCKPCIAEMPSIEKAQDILHKEDVVFLMASSESAEEINAFRNAHNYKFKYARIENSEELNIQGLPTTFIFNAEGKLVFSEMGYRKWDEKNNIDMLIKIANNDD